VNVEDHPPGLDGRPGGAVIVSLFRRSCGRASCPVCFEKWAGLQGRRAEHRLKRFQVSLARFRKVIHVAVSVARCDWALEYPGLRRKAYKLARFVGVRGGCVVFHPWRKKGSEWVWSPHFHMLGFGWISGERVREVHKGEGWLIKNVGVRKRPRAVLAYLLSHAGIHPHRQTVTWFGALSYNKFSCSPYVPEEEVCPVCGGSMKPLLHEYVLDVPDPPAREGVYWVKGAEWGFHDE
jgi:hypothetical protein